MTTINIPEWKRETLRGQITYRNLQATEDGERRRSHLPWGTIHCFFFFPNRLGYTIPNSNIIQIIEIALMLLGSEIVILYDNKVYKTANHKINHRLRREQ